MLDRLLPTMRALLIGLLLFPLGYILANWGELGEKWTRQILGVETVSV